jgi:hypothetical protein
MHQLQSIYDGLTFEMIVGDYEGGIAAFGHMLDACSPRVEFLPGVEVVIPL